MTSDPGINISRCDDQMSNQVYDTATFEIDQTIKILQLLAIFKLKPFESELFIAKQLVHPVFDKIQNSEGLIEFKPVQMKLFQMLPSVNSILVSIERGAYDQ